jgi:hypothetical protein
MNANLPLQMTLSANVLLQGHGKMTGIDYRSVDAVRGWSVATFLDMELSGTVTPFTPNGDLQCEKWFPIAVDRTSNRFYMMDMAVQAIRMYWPTATLIQIESR